MSNQASEDKQTKAIYKAMQIPYLSERHDAIKSLIRTEKLKLLAGIKSEWEKFGEGTNMSDGEYEFLDIIEKLEAEL